MPRNTKRIIIEVPHKKKQRRGGPGRPFTKDNPPPNIFKPGQSGNPAGRPRTTVLSIAYKEELAKEAPSHLKAVFNIDGDCTVAQLIATGLAHRGALSDTTAARELREATEGRLPTAGTGNEGTIDYTAGKTAKEMLLSKLEPKQLPQTIEGTFVENQPEPQGEDPHDAATT